MKGQREKKKMVAYTSMQLPPDEDEKITRDLISLKMDHDKKKNWEERLRSEFDVHREHIAKKAAPNFLIGRWNIAAGLLVLVGGLLGYYYFFGKTFPTVAQPYITALDIPADPMVTRKGAFDVHEIRMKAMEEYGAGHYKGVVTAYQTLIEKEAYDGLDLLYLSASLLKLGAPDEAEKWIVRAIDLGGPREELDWCLALAYADQKKYDKSADVLRQIVNRQQYMHVRARELLEAIGNTRHLEN